MMNADNPEEKLPWRKTQLLGQGAFGCIHLWENVETKEKLAIKTCKHKEEMSDKTWERWKMEVYIMGKLKHENVVRAVDLPEKLSPQSGQPPALAMEYCEGGDLRKVLNRPDNCCGLKENEIRQLLTGVGSAIEYLHSNRIIHRDLKPENIVLKCLDENKILYKIIDLGYAKELDLSSICNSYVGTMQYLAPELFVTKPYSKTVDYWSFGCLVFECIAGFRPFLPTLPPVEWHNVVCKKSPDDINAQYDENKEIKFSKKLPPNNQLCRPLQNYLEQWLRLMLRWDPKARGGGIVQAQGIERPKCFCVLEQIMAIKILHILYVEMNSILSFNVNETHTMKEVHAAIELETGIPPQQQYIILANGVKLEPTDTALQGCSDPNTEEVIVFLFRRGNLQYQAKNKKLPQQVQAIAKEPSTLLPPKDHRKAWAHAVHWCAVTNRDYKRIILSHRAALLSLLRSNSLVSKQKWQMTSEMGKLMACKDHFQTSLDFDLQKCKENIENDKANVWRSKMYEVWTHMASQLNEINNLQDRVNSIDSKATAITTEIVELQRSPSGKPKQNNDLDEFETGSKKLYSELIRATQGAAGDGSHEMMDHYPMVDLVGRCLVKREEQTKLLFKHLSKVLDCQLKLEPILPDLDNACSEIAAASQQLKTMQLQRQTDMWNVFHWMCGNGKDPANDFPPLPSNILYTSYSSNLESIQLMDDFKTNALRLQDVVETMLREQEEHITSLEN
ncbi:inhibitor of nuclear factor kappa-B kinase subunit alpha-like [Physella acuta]|uniref:inhibitor of nuclear factor kappa-B kinase subunit alpha-like n=1 Tax=Physella acuta TaxID=109671 RepID=UPI0027DE1E53|nr:inhibitor of nuclear factor kappa-B kinase subunit alpha-like [Physella acuta]